MVGGSNLEKYSLTAASDSARVISYGSLSSKNPPESHESGLPRARLASPSAEKSAKKCMIATIEGRGRRRAFFYIIDREEPPINNGVINKMEYVPKDDPMVRVARLKV